MLNPIPGEKLCTFLTMSALKPACSQKIQIGRAFEELNCYAVYKSLQP
jgi:hypothetical protein